MAQRFLLARRAQRGFGCLALVLGTLVATIPAARAQTPAIIQTFTDENMVACQGAGGTPALLDSYLSDAGDLNGDGAADYVTDLAGLDCANAWSFFCGSAGCPATVWLSGPQDYTVGWGGSAQAWRLRGKEVVLSLHGQLCDPPRIGAEGCEIALRFDPAPLAPTERPEPAIPRAAAPDSDGGVWRVRLLGDRPTVAEAPGVGRLSALTALCLRDRPVMMAALSDEGGASSVTFSFDFGDRRIDVTGVAGATTGRTYILDPRIGGLGAAMADGAAEETRLLIAGEDQGALSLNGAATALREVLSPCLTF